MRKPLSEEDEAFFRSALKDARPLKKRRTVALQAPRPGRAVMPLPQAPRRSPHAGSGPPFEESPPLSGHVAVRLRRGRRDPEARLDLHGLTHDAAYRALQRFLWRAQAEGKALVLVITGKGGVLRKHLPFWLGEPELKPLVAGLSEAHLRHGGSGAFYVALRKPKRLQARP